MELNIEVIREVRSTKTELVNKERLKKEIYEWVKDEKHSFPEKPIDLIDISTRFNIDSKSTKILFNELVNEKKLMKLD